MKVERPVIYMQTVCDICNRDIKDEEEYIRADKCPTKRNQDFRRPKEMDICLTCFDKLTPPKPQAQFCVSASYAITSSWAAYPTTSSYISLFDTNK